MQVTIKLFATLRTGRFCVRDCPIPDGRRIEAILADLGIHDQEVGLILHNNRPAETDRLLSNGDTVALFPLIGGG